MIRKPAGASVGDGEDPTVLIAGGEQDLFRFLESRGLISRQQSDDLKRKVVLGTESLAERLVEDGLAAKAVATALGDYFGISGSSQPRLEGDPALLSRTPPGLWRESLALPVGRDQDKVIAVTCDPSLTVLHEELERAVGKPLIWSLVPVPSLREALARALGPKLIVRREDGSRRDEHVLRSDAIYIGKNSDCDLVIDDPTVSRRHARLEQGDQGRWAIHDEGSANGTFVDGRRISGPVSLQSGAQIRVGQTEMVFFDANDEGEGLATDQVDHSPVEEPAAETATLQAQGPSPSSEKRNLFPDHAAEGPGDALETVKADKKASRKKKSKKGKKDKKVDSRMKAAWVRVAGQFIATLAAVVTPLLIFQLMKSDRRPDDGGDLRGEHLFREPFPESFEPSGVLQVRDGGKIFFVDDSRPGALFGFELDSRGRIRGSQVDEFPFSSSSQAIDLEGLTLDSASGAIYALSSHALDRKGREVESALLRLEVGDSGLEVVESLLGLRQDLLAHYAILEPVADLAPEKGGLNLEAIAWDPSGSRLLIGVRSPLERTYRGDEALLFALEAGQDGEPFALASARLADEPIFLDLGGAGFRGMEFDAETGGFLLVSGGTTRAGEFQIWEWSGEEGSKPVEIPTERFARGQKPEGIARVKLANGESVILLVDDSGGYFVLAGNFREP